MKKFFLPLVAIAALFSSCADDNFKPKDYTEVSVNYQLIYDETGNDGLGAYYPIAYFANEEGFSSELESDHTVTFSDGENNDKLYFQSYGYYYVSLETYNYLPQNMEGDFILTTPDGATFTNTATLEEIFMSDYDMQVDRTEDYTFTWSGQELSEGDYIKAYLLDEDDYVLTSTTVAYDEEEETTYEITFDDKDMMYATLGEGSIKLERYTSRELTEEFGVNSSYTVGVYCTSQFPVTIINGVDE